MKRKILLIGVWLVFIVGTWLTAYPKEIKALDSCSSSPLNFDIDLVPGLPRRKNKVIVSGLFSAATYHFEVVQRSLGQDIQKEIVELIKTNGFYQGELKDAYSVQTDGGRKFFIRQNNTRICEGTYNLPPLRPKCQNIVSPPSITTAEKDTTDVHVKFQNIGERAYYSNPVIRVEGEFATIPFPDFKSDNDGTFYGIFLAGTVDWDVGTNKIALDDKTVQIGVCVATFYVGPVGMPTPTPGVPPGEFDPCTGDTTEKCKDCLGDLLPDGGRENSAQKVWTALGCLPTDPADFVAWLLSTAISIGGGIAFLLMLGGGFQIMTSSGNPDKLNKGKETLTSAGVGLLFIIFAVLLLKIIGIDIFQLPGWVIP